MPKINYSNKEIGDRFDLLGECGNMREFNGGDAFGGVVGCKWTRYHLATAVTLP
jgi:hypothetical protein